MKELTPEHRELLRLRRDLEELRAALETEDARLGRRIARLQGKVSATGKRVGQFGERLYATVRQLDDDVERWLRRHLEPHIPESRMLSQLPHRLEMLAELLDALSRRVDRLEEEGGE